MYSEETNVRNMVTTLFGDDVYDDDDLLRVQEVAAKVSYNEVLNHSASRLLSLGFTPSAITTLDLDEEILEEEVIYQMKQVEETASILPVIHKAGVDPVLILEESMTHDFEWDKLVSLELSVGGEVIEEIQGPAQQWVEPCPHHVINNMSVIDGERRVVWKGDGSHVLYGVANFPYGQTELLLRVRAGKNWYGLWLTRTQAVVISNEVVPDWVVRDELGKGHSMLTQPKEMYEALGIEQVLWYPTWFGRRAERILVCVDGMIYTVESHPRIVVEAKKDGMYSKGGQRKWSNEVRDPGLYEMDTVTNKVICGTDRRYADTKEIGEAILKSVRLDDLRYIYASKPIILKIYKSMRGLSHEEKLKEELDNALVQSRQMQKYKLGEQTRQNLLAQYFMEWGEWTLDNFSHWCIQNYYFIKRNMVRKIKPVDTRRVKVTITCVMSESVHLGFLRGSRSKEQIVVGTMKKNGKRTDVNCLIIEREMCRGHLGHFMVMLKRKYQLARVCYVSVVCAEGVRFLRTVPLPKR